MLLRVWVYLSLALGVGIVLGVHRAPRVLVGRLEVALRSGRLDVTVYGEMWDARPSGVDWSVDRRPVMTWRVLPRVRSRTLEVPLWGWLAGTGAEAAYLFGVRRGRKVARAKSFVPGVAMIITGLVLAIPLPDTTSQVSRGGFRAILNGGYVGLGVDRSTTLNTSNFAGSERLLWWPRWFDAGDLKLPAGSWGLWVPLWQVPLGLLLAGSWMHGRARGSRIVGVLCPNCEYALDGIKADAEGRRTCPECGVGRER